MLFEVVVILTILIGFVALYVAVQRLMTRQQTEHIEAQVDRIFGMSAQRVAEQSRQILQGEKETIKTDLENKHQALEKLVKALQQDMAERQREIRVLEQDRVKKFGELTATLKEHQDLARELRVSTEQLAQTLSNNQLRGEWGERIIEDLLQSNGMLEGVHYVRQTNLGASTSTGSSAKRPDITLLLPDQRVVAVDVKFPYKEMQKMLQAETTASKSIHEKQFGSDIKHKIEKVAEYIVPEANTLDYAILFVPNEMVFSFINQKYPQLVDEAVSRRVLLVSPFTFLIVARTVMESYRNFLLGDKLKEVVQYVEEFATEWERFKSAFEKYGRTLTTLQSDYEQLTGTRVRQMERRIEKVRQLNSGTLQDAAQPPELES